MLKIHLNYAHSNAALESTWKNTVTTDDNIFMMWICEEGLAKPWGDFPKLFLFYGGIFIVIALSDEAWHQI